MADWAIGDKVMVAASYKVATVPRVEGVPDRDLIHERGRVIWADGEFVDVVLGAAVLRLPASILKRDPTPFGFQWGPVEVIRLTTIPWRDDRETRVIGITTDAGVELEVNVSQAGRSVRVYRKRKGQAVELLARKGNG